MIRELFETDKPVFVRCEEGRLIVGNARRDQLEAAIADICPVRKRFDRKQLVCWSNDGVTGKHGQRCALCSDRWACTQRVRLMFLARNIAKEDIPAILEIGQNSFDALEDILRQVQPDQAGYRNVRIAIDRTAGNLAFAFEPAG